MSETKDFPTGDVISTATGFLVTRNGIGGVYDVLNWMTGESVFTHQIPRISREARPVLLAAHPDLALAYEEAKLVTRDNWGRVLETWIDRYGETIAVPKFGTDEHKSIDPVSELARMVPIEKIIVVQK
jgi:hypothetical protein